MPQPQNKRATRAEVAALAGVSKTTVTFVLNERRDIAIPEATRERVKNAAAQLGYQPSAIARALVSGRSQTVTLVFVSLKPVHYTRVLRAFERETYAHNYQMIASTLGHIPPGTAKRDIERIFNSATDGVILVDVHKRYEPLIDLARPFNKPVVSMGVFSFPDCDRVEVDLLTGCRVALKHLVDQSPKRIAFFGPGNPANVEAIIANALDGDADPRFVAYCETMRDLGRPFEFIFGPIGDRASSMDTLKAYVEEHGCPDAIQCYDDEVGIAAHRAVREMGLRIPGDVMLIGCDGNEECEYLDPALSTIVQPIGQICAEAWNFMTQRLDDPMLEPQYKRMEAQVVVRGSSLRV